jgi:hypothetical protein
LCWAAYQGQCCHYLPADSPSMDLLLPLLLRLLLLAEILACHQQRLHLQ